MLIKCYIFLSQIANDSEGLIRKHLLQQYSTVGKQAHQDDDGHKTTDCRLKLCFVLVLEGDCVAEHVHLFKCATDAPSTTWGLLFPIFHYF